MVHMNDYVKVSYGAFEGEHGVVTEVIGKEDNTVVCIDNRFYVLADAVTPYVPPIEVKYFNDKCKLEQHGDWIDLKSARSTYFKKNSFVKIPLGVAMKLPSGYEAHMLPRSSTFEKYGIIMTNSMGIIDEAYCGDDDQWSFPAFALRDGVIEEGDRIAQFRIVKHQPTIALTEVELLGNKNRGGFGSTGK